MQNILTKTEEELDKYYCDKLKSLADYKLIDEYMKELNEDRKTIVDQMVISENHDEMETLHQLKYANFCATRDAKHKKMAIFKSTHKRPKF